ncbi:MAG: DCC1-like thiol-disulfide oxidoreductase family protein [Pseudomonadota bacterium]
MASDDKDLTPAYIVYDGQCPFCTSYVRLLRLRETVGPVELIDARSNHPVVAEVTGQNLDLNEGMAFLHEGQIFYGDKCVTQLALLSTPVGLFNRINAAVFRRGWAARFLYPVLKAGRRVALFALRRGPIQQP